MRSWLLTAAVAAAVALPASAQAPTWKTYPFPDLGYAVDFPAEPQRNDDQTPTQRGAVRASFVALDLGLRAFGVTSADYARTPAGAPTDANAMVEASMAGLLKGRTVLSQTVLSVPGGAGRETISKDGASLARFRAYYRAPYVYIVTVMTNDTLHPDLLQDAVANRFFSSFTPLSR